MSAAVSETRLLLGVGRVRHLAIRWRFHHRECDCGVQAAGVVRCWGQHVAWAVVGLSLAAWALNYLETSDHKPESRVLRLRAKV